MKIGGHEIHRLRFVRARNHFAAQRANERVKRAIVKQRWGHG